MKNKNIVLIGMPGAGKSTIGVSLSKALRMPFVDTDLLIRRKEKKFLQDIINIYGIDKFLEIEESIVLGIDIKNHIIATGGSVVYSEAAIGHLKENGFLVYLQLEFSEVQRRIRNISSRGIAMGEGQALSDIYRERVPLYEKYADFTVNCSGKRVEQVVSIIKGEIEKKFR